MNDAAPNFINTIIFDDYDYFQEEIYTSVSANPNLYFCDIEGGLEGIGGDGACGDYENCIDIDPQFVGSGDDPYKLLETSPCINFGDPATTTNQAREYDLAGEERIQQGIIDIGAYEVHGATNGYPGNALEFDGIDDFVMINDNIDLTSNYTIELWFNTSESDRWMDMLAGTISDEHGILLEITSGNELRFLHRNPPGVSGGSEIYSGDSYNDGMWHHLAAVKDGSVIKLFVDGKLIGSDDAATNFTQPVDILFGKIKPNVSDRFFAGKLDEISIWNQALSVTEIRENMHLSLEGTETGLVSYYQFNEIPNSYANDFISGNYAILNNMENIPWIDSSIPVGSGESATIIVTGNNCAMFNDIAVFMEFSQHTAVTDTIVATRIDVSPNVNPANVYETLDSQYWVIDQFGEGTFNLLYLNFTVQEELTVEDENYPQQIQAYKRNSNSDLAWNYTYSAASVYPSPYNQVYFENITELSQFIICRNAVPDIDVSATSFTENLLRGNSSTQQLTIENIGTGNLNFEISLSGNRESGGPDAFGYKWIDDDESGGPSYNWFDISSIGTEILSNSILTYGNRDDGYKEVALPFNFFFYGENKTTVKISSNGYLTFGNNGSAWSCNNIPSANEPNDFIAPFWLNLDVTDSGSIYYYFDQTNNRFIVQYQEVPQQGTPVDTFTFQVILYNNGEILFQYADMDDTYWSTVGIENSDGSDGLEISHYSHYIQNELAVKIYTEHWLELSETSGSLSAGVSSNIEVTFSARNLTAGEYTDNIVITSNDDDEPEITIPVTLTITEEDPTLPVTLSSFAGFIENGYPILHWITESELENLGWNIYRSTDENGIENNNIIKLNEELIPGMGTVTTPTEYNYTDEKPVNQTGVHYYWLESISYSGEIELFDPISINLSNSNLIPHAPAKSFVNKNYPNPFNPITKIEFGIKAGETGIITIYNIRGQKVLSHKYEQGYHTFEWNALKQASGVYFYQLKTPSFFKSNKMLMLK